MILGDIGKVGKMRGGVPLKFTRDGTAMHREFFGDLASHFPLLQEMSDDHPSIVRELDMCHDEGGEGSRGANADDLTPVISYHDGPL